MIPFKRIHHVLINVPTGMLAEAQNFYECVLELPIILGERPFTALWFKMADVELHVMEEEAGSLSERHPAFEVTDLKASEGFLKSKAIEISYSLKIEGRDRLFFRDPFGNRFELIEYS